MKFFFVNLKVSLLVILLTLIIGSKSMAQSIELIGTWRVDTDSTLEIMDAERKTQYDTLLPEVKAKILNVMDGREFIFSENGEVKVSWKIRDNLKSSLGYWTMDESKSEFSITIDGVTSNYSYEFRTPQVLILIGSGNRGFFNNLYLNKIN